jgi:hypothetical protein
MTASTVFFLLLVLACPLMMWAMMRGGHGHSSHGNRDQSGPAREPERPASTYDLRRQREELDSLIEERELTERELTPSGRDR